MASNINKKRKNSEQILCINLILPKKYFGKGHACWDLLISQQQEYTRKT